MKGLCITFSRPHDAESINGEKQCHVQVLAIPGGKAVKQAAGILQQDHDNSSGDLKNLNTHTPLTSHSVLMGPGRDRMPAH